MPSTPSVALFHFLLLFVVCQSSKDAIPVHLEACYRGDVVPLPRTLSSLRDLIIKIENSSPLLVSVDIAAALLHRFSYDGIERDPRVASSSVYEDNVIPYRTTGCQRVRSQLLRDYLLPGFASPFFPPNLLSVSEQCTLHFMLSSSVDPWERGDEYKICPSLMSAHNPVDVQTGALRSPCPTEGGIMLAGGQAVSPARFLAGIIAVLNPVDFEFDNRVVMTQWAASISGDLAEVAAFQAGIVQQPWVGASGIWNDTILPTQFYMLEKGLNFTKFGLWQLTDAELLGDIDALMIGSLLSQSGVSQLRLSQLLDLYYSETGATQGFSSAADREKFLPEIIGSKKQILYQAKLFARMIEESTPTVNIDSAKLDEYLEKAFSAFVARTKVIKLGATFEKRNPSTKSSLNVIFDSTYPPYYTLKILYELADGIDVWEWGSRLSAINGETGDIVVRDAVTKGGIWLNWLNATKEVCYAEKLVLSKALLGLQRLMKLRDQQICWNAYESHAYSQVTLVLDVSNSLTDKEFSLASHVLHDIFVQHPEMNFTFVTHNTFEIKDLIEPQYIERVRLIDPNDFLEKSLYFISQVDRVLMPGPCCTRRRDADTELREVGYPTLLYHYRIPSEYFCKTPVPSLNIVNDMYGSVTVCVGYARGSSELGCLLIGPTTSDSVPLKNAHCPFPPCPGLHFYISVNSTSRNCNEMLCETSDGVPYNLHLVGMKCLSNLTTLCSSAPEFKSFDLLLLSLFFVFICNFDLNR